MLDRLETAGFVAREPDPADRRRIILRLLPARIPEVTALFASIGARLQELCAEYSTEELSLVLEFMQKRTELVKASASELREKTPQPAKKKAAQ